MKRVSKTGVSAHQCAGAVLEVAPLIMRHVRVDVRQGRKRDLTVQAFRTLVFLHHFPGASLSQAAQDVGVMKSSMSRIVDSLMKRKMIAWESAHEDLRRLKLTLTAAGEREWAATTKNAKADLAAQFRTLTEAQRAQVVQTFQLLRPLFADKADAAGVLR